jgi:hypothetical protein
MAQLAGLRCVTAPEAQTEFESGAPKIDVRSKLPVWLVGVAVRKVGDRKTSAIDVKVVSATAPEVGEGDAVRIEGLEASLWENNGRAGLSWRASAISKAAVPAAPAPGSSAAPAASAPAGTPASASRPSGKAGEA